MTDTELNEALAKWAGKDGQALYPDYTGSIDAQVPLLKKADGFTFHYDYLAKLLPALGIDPDEPMGPRDVYAALTATACQRAEALAKTLGLWKD